MKLSCWLLIILVVPQATTFVLSNSIIRRSKLSSKNELFDQYFNKNQQISSNHQLNHQNSLYIVGCGNLGLRVAKKWLELHPSAFVVGETYGDNQHSNLIQQGVYPVTRNDRSNFLQKCTVNLFKKEDINNSKDDIQKFKFNNVVFCVPPSKFENDEYAQEVELALNECWDNSSCESKTSELITEECDVIEPHESDKECFNTKQRGHGGFVFTSSGSVYLNKDETSLYLINENSQVDINNIHAMKILKAEDATIKGDGCVIRLAGL